MRAAIFSAAIAVGACSVNTVSAGPLTFTTVSAPEHATASADGSYTYEISFTYSDPGDYAATLQLTYKGATQDAVTNATLRPGATSQVISVGPFPATARGKSYDYTLVLIGASGLKSEPYAAHITFD